jgi:hypothetical protein
MTALRADVEAALRSLPQARALRRAALRESEQFAHVVDRIACSPLAPSVRVVLLLEVAYRALLAASTVTASAPVPAAMVRAVSTRPAVVQRLLAMGAHWRDRCPGCGLAFGPDGCVPGRCCRVTGWEPRVTPGQDGTGEWDG